MRFPSVGEQFGRYLVGPVIGQGGMGVVYQATDTTLRRTVALKIIQPALAADPHFRQRFEREANILARLRSQYIVQILEYGEIDGTVYLATDYVPDGDLHAWLAAHGALGARQALFLVRAVCEALDDAHRAGVVHRDVKPSNVLLWQRTQGELIPYLCDVGIATDADGALTRTRTIVGSCAFMAPERHLGQPATPRSDIYSAGCVLWAVLTGRAPYSGTDFQLMQAHLNEPVPQVPPATPGAAAINPILQRALAKDPAQRYATAGEFAAALAAAAPHVPEAPLVSGAPTALRRPSTPPPAGPPLASTPPEPTFLADARLPAPPPAVPQQLGWPVVANPPRRGRRRWPWYVAAAAALVLLVGGGVTAYATGRLGVGPLSADDKAVARTVAAAVGQPTWANADQRSCAAEKLLHERRAKQLRSDGVVKADHAASTGWALTGTWTEADATAYLKAVLDCSDDWSAQVADQWHLTSPACLHDVGADALAAYFATDLKPKDADTGAGARAATVKKLDACYAVAPSKPQVSSTSAYRAVRFTVTPGSATNGTTATQVRRNGSWSSYDGDAQGVVTAATERGGAQACAQVRTTTTYGWGTARTSEASACGRAQPAKVWWAKDTHCTLAAGCTTWDLRYSGLRSYDLLKVTFKQNHGDCHSADGQCSFEIDTGANGKGRAGSWSAYPGYHDYFTATLDGMTAVLPD